MNVSRETHSQIAFSPPRMADDIEKKREERKRGSVIKSPWRAWSSIPLVSTRACVTTHALSHSWRALCGTRMQLVWVITVSRFFDRVLFLPFLLFLSPSFGSLFGPACAMHNNRRDRRGGGGGGEGGDGVRACTVQFSPETSNRSKPRREIYTHVKHACAHGSSLIFRGFKISRAGGGLFLWCFSEDSVKFTRV